MDVNLFLEELGVPTSYLGKGDYKKYKEERFLGRLKIMLALYLEKGCCDFVEDNILFKKLQDLSKEEKNYLKNSLNPVEMLNLFVDWKEGELSFYSEQERVQLSVSFEGSEYLLQQSFPKHKSRCKKRQEQIKAKNSLSLSVIRDLIEKGIIPF